VLLDRERREARSPELAREVVEMRLGTPRSAAVLEHEMVTVLQSHEKTSSPGLPVIDMKAGAGEEGTVMRSNRVNRCTARAAEARHLSIRIDLA
jgi:hypothetical protein